MKLYKVRPELRVLFTNLVREDHASAGRLVNEGGRKSIDPELHSVALKALDALEAAGLLEVIEKPSSYVESPIGR
ncbi:MAG TPA: hypothetical protein VFG23_00040 [Polyangia bacterium]|nr:hypothetical protein [Polyangia bacterium]